MSDTLTLVRLEGPYDDAIPSRLTLDVDTAVGRAVENEVCLPAPSVSRHHAALRRTAGGWFLTDEGSTSGTTLNARRLDPGTPAPLEPGDRIGIGPWLFRVADDPTAARTVGLTIDQPGTAAVPISSRRLDALSLDAQANTKRRQESLRINLDRARELRAMMLPPPPPAPPRIPG